MGNSLKYLVLCLPPSTPSDDAHDPDDDSDDALHDPLGPRRGLHASSVLHASCPPHHCIFELSESRGRRYHTEMSSYSSSFSGPSSPVFASVVPQTARGHSRGPRSLRAGSSYQHSSHPGGENGSRTRYFDQREGPHSPDRITSRKSPRAAVVSNAGLFPIQTDRKSHSTRPKVRSNSPSDSGSPTSSPSRKALGSAGVTSTFSQRAGFQAHQRHHEPTAAEYTNRRLLLGQQIQVARSSPARSALPLPLSSFSPPSTPPPRRSPQHRRAALASPPDSLPSPLSTPASQRVRFPTSGLSTPPSSARSRSSRYVTLFR